MLDIYALKVFLEAARVESFTRAGRALNLSQPAVSHHIRSLEEYLQVDLFERRGRYIHLTKAGQSLIPMARQAVQLVVSIEDVMRSVEGEVSGNLVIGCSEPSAFYLLPHLIARFKRIYPNIRIMVPVMPRENMVASITRGDIDLGISGTRYAPDHNLHSYKLYEDDLVLVVPSAHPFVAQQVIQIEDLLAQPFICRDVKSICRKVVGSELARLGYDVEQLDIVMEIDSPEAQAMAVEHGIGLSFMPLLTVKQRLPLGRLAVVEVESLALKTPIYLVSSAERATTLVYEAFIRFLDMPQTRNLVEGLASGSMA